MYTGRIVYLFSTLHPVLVFVHDIDLENVPAKKSGERWAHFNDYPALAMPQADSGISVVYLEPRTQAAFGQPAVCLNESQEQGKFICATFTTFIYLKKVAARLHKQTCMYRFIA